jgi:hypothetical protein
MSQFEKFLHHAEIAESAESDRQGVFFAFSRTLRDIFKLTHFQDFSKAQNNSKAGKSLPALLALCAFA